MGSRKWNLFNVFNVTILTLSLVLSATSSPRPSAQHRTRSSHALKCNHPVPHVWQKVLRAQAHDRIRLEIGLRHGQFEELERHLHEGKDSSFATPS
jgi:tripeptidyl-peptidase I